ncbi:ABC transporter permease [Dyadobacter psychrotolerans]|uniref:FtsX-like permease family protein n=1 Tax=Dyadobacter psychrotolerans TaxID=2541721 RepID=A0A4R5DVP1_9BACT|nr:ABC transporter permease [Dyadobacter psychrotolerans]TDE18529.1 FtsX-like permease family protein [Dyadobacter psychrotolerans]
MIKNYFKIGFRTLIRNKSYAFINVAGLALGLAACIVIFLVVQNELGYDRFHKKADRTYRVTLHGLDYNPSVSFAIAPAFRNDFPEAEQVSQYYYQNNGLLKVGQERYNEEGFAYADGNFSKIFDFQWLSGDQLTALKDPNTIVLTESIAKKYFGEKDALGKIIRLDNRNDLTVTGVIKDLPSNTHFTFNFLVSWETIKKDVDISNFWSIQGGMLYVALPEGFAAKNVSDHFPAFIKKNWGADIAKDTELILQPLTDIHFDQNYLNQVSMPRSKQTVYGLAGIALFIILTACINFVNLATAQSLQRAKEVGIRKTLGAYRKQLIAQVMGETTLLVGLAVVFALTAVWLFLPSTESLLNIKIDSVQLFNPQIVVAIAAVTVSTILIAGLYPALIQSGFKPVKALKSGVTNHSVGNSNFRKALVVVQFAITQVLIVGTIVVGSQMDFFLNQEMGFEKDAVITFPTGEKREVLNQKLLDNPGVEEVSFASGGPVYNSNFAPFSSPELGMADTDVTELKFVDENYIPMYELQLLAGKSITKIVKKDSVFSVVVNETLIKRLGIQDPEKAIGKRILIGQSPARINGVVHDFQSESKHDKIRACILTYNSGLFWQASVKLHPENKRQTLASINKDWSELNPESLFTYEFVDEHIAKLYVQEEKMYNAFKIFSGIAILIGCLGLYGLVSLMAVQKTKEIGIRKVLGASVPGIVLLFFNQFIWLIVAAFVVAAPLAWFAMGKWLEEFAYHIQIGPGIFTVSILATVIIAGLTISYQSIRAALIDPVKSLKSE